MTFKNLATTQDQPNTWTKIPNAFTILDGLYTYTRSVVKNHDAHEAIPLMAFNTIDPHNRRKYAAVDIQQSNRQELVYMRSELFRNRISKERLVSRMIGGGVATHPDFSPYTIRRRSRDSTSRLAHESGRCRLWSRGWVSLQG
jgi:hypothetical protein